MDTNSQNDERSGVVAALKAAVLVREGDSFSMVEPIPDWWEPAFGSLEVFRDRSPFLDNFIDHGAGDFWENGGTDSRLCSGIWEEARNSDGEERRHFFEAIASGGHNGEAALLMILPADERWREEQAFVQGAHDQSLSRRRLLKELEKKQVLLECIMHDLGNPVATVFMNLQHIDRQIGDDYPELKPAVRRAIAQAERQRQLIRSIAEVFAADLAGSRDSIEGNSPDLVAVAAETVAACAPAASEAGVTLCPFFSGPIAVLGEKLALSRVIENLLVNAIRHSPKGGTVSLSFETDGDFAVCRIEDQGPGVDTSLGERIFQPFVQGKSNEGQSGLGLYFCRLTVEMWGGSIEVGNRESGGAAFSFRLPLAGETSKNQEGGS